jgi:3-dehydroquinate dehydratase-2
MRVLVVHGPNLNLLGEREPALYGSTRLDEIDAAIGAEATRLGITTRCVQFNGEGAIIDALHGARTECDGVVINPGAYAHYSYAIRDAIAAIGIPAIEVHLTNVAARETFRRSSVTAAACRGVVSGLGPVGYLLALRALAEMERR